MDFTVINGDVDKTISIMKEVAAWGRSAGFKVWKDEWLTKQELLTNDNTEEEFCIGKVSGINACCMILQWKDSEFWPNSELNEAGYIHKLCVRRAYAGTGLSRKMVEYAKEECSKRGIKYLRLDTGWTETKMRELYINLGFKIVKKIEFDNGGAVALYELKVNEGKCSNYCGEKIAR